MDWANFINNLPTIAWIVAIMIICVIAFAFYSLYNLLLNKDVKIHNIELKALQNGNEVQQSIGKNLLDNQTSNAHDLLEQVWIDIYEKGKQKFKLANKKDLFLLEDIAHLIENSLNNSVKGDLTRNHIVEKDDAEIERYSNAKATGYHKSVKAMLYRYNEQLPFCSLPDVMDDIPISDYKQIFREIYVNAREIAGGNCGK